MRAAPRGREASTPTESTSDHLHGALVLGMLAGLATALADYGALWLWLPTWPLRGEVLFRLLTFQAAAGSLLAGLLFGLSRVRLPWLGTRNPVVVWVIAAAPFCGWLAAYALEGGSMRQLPHRPLIASTGAALLVFGFGTVLILGRRWVNAAARSARLRIGLVLVAGLIFVAATKIDQHALPKLYEPFHGVLTFVAWSAAMAILLLVDQHLRAASSPWPARIGRWTQRRPSYRALGVVAVSLVISIATLSKSPNARVALHDSRAASSHSLMLAIGPALAWAEPRSRMDDAIARARERARSRATRIDGLPQMPDAHVLVITIDALRADHLGTYGYTRPISPNLDAFAETALVFEHAYTVAPHSSYSLSSLWTSHYIHQRVELGQSLPDRTMAAVLADAGYHTAAFYTQGIFHTEGERMRVYEDDAFQFARHEHANLEAEPLTDAALEEFTRIAEAGEPPSLTWVHYFDVHEPYREMALGTDDIDRYDGEIQNVDRAIARLIEGARARLQRPIVIALTADHGEEFRDHGGVYHGSTLYDEQVRVPMLLHVPGVDPRRVETPVEVVDLAPTLLELVDHTDATMRGDDLRPLFDEERTWPPAFGAVSYKKMVVRWPYKLVADLRFELFELYDLAEDPHERINLAGDRPELLDELKGEVYAWLDAERSSGDPHQSALALGRMRDRRAVEALCTLLHDADAPTEWRTEAAQLLARLAAPRSADALAEVMQDDPDPLIRAEAAVALGRQFDERARAQLQRVVRSEDPDLRSRAAVSLGRLRDPQAVPALIDALHVSRESYERQEAVRWLGRLRDPAALDPLLALLPEFRVRHLTVVALGHLGDPRAYGPLARTLQWEHHRHVRDNAARALGQLGDRRAIPLVLPLAQSEADLKYPPEALVRLGALETGEIGGLDMLRPRAGLSDCQQGPERHDWNYLNRTSCKTTQQRIRLPLRAPNDTGADAVLGILRARRVDAQEPAEIQVHIGSLETAFQVDGEWSSHRWNMTEVPRAASILLPDDVVLELDHLLLLPIESGDGVHGPEGRGG